VCAQWYPLGLQLKLRTGTLDRIYAQFRDPRDQLREMLKTWLITSDNTSWKTLTEALKSRTVEKSLLASVLETKYSHVKGAEVDRGISANDSWPYTSITSISPGIHTTAMCGRFYSEHMHNTQFYHSYSYLGNSYSTTVQGVCVNATSRCLGPQFLSPGSSVYGLPLMYSSLTLHTAHKLLVIQYYFRLLSIFDSNNIICLLVNLHGRGLLLSKHVLFSIQMF